MFRDRVPEHLIFRGHTALPFVLVAPAIGLVFEHARGFSWLAFAIGVFAWTLLEYAMHRFLFHFPARGRAAKIVTFVVHGHHHVAPKERSRLAATPVQFGSLAALMTAIALAVPHPDASVGLAGALTGYLGYEAVHHLAHHGPTPRNALLRALVRHHMQHHHGSADACWGISTPLWDWVFRTAAARAKATQRAGTREPAQDASPST